MEQWKDIPGYEWLYKVNIGWEIMSLPKKWKWWHNWKILKMWIDWRWYVFTKIYKDKIYKNIKAHKAVMLAFVWESNWLQVNHKDWNKLNNSLYNLEYCTISENIKHAFDNWLNKASKSSLWKVWILNKNSKLVWRFDLNWILIDKWYLFDYNKLYWYDRTSIVKVCNKNTRLKTAYGFNWKYL